MVLLPDFYLDEKACFMTRAVGIRTKDVITKAGIMTRARIMTQKTDIMTKKAGMWYYGMCT